MLSKSFHNNNASLIKSFTQTGRYLQSLFLFKKLLLSATKPENPLLFPPLLNSCSRLPSPNYGLGIHGFLIKSGFGNWFGTEKSMMIMYAKFGLIEDAYRMFDEMPGRDEDVCNSLICSFGLSEFYDQVLVVFDEMVQMGVSVNLCSLVRVIVACGELGFMEKGIFVYEFVMRNGFDSSVLVSNLLISMFVKMGRLDLGRRIFDDLRCRDIVSWNSLITGYFRSGCLLEVFELFESMKKQGTLVPNQVTLLALLSASGQAKNIDFGRSIHGHVVSTGLLSDFRMGTAILDMYAKCDMIEFARTIFEEDLSHKSLVSWNSLISGYSQNGYVHEAITIFKRMMIEAKSKPDSITFANVIPAFASVANIANIQALHSLILKKGLDMDRDVVLGTSMVNAYAKCSNIEGAKILFNAIKKPNAATWNALIEGCNLNYLYEEGMLYFLEMLQTKMVPDEVTMVMLFQLCGKLRLMKLGKMVHGFCLSSGFSSILTLENALIDMYMRCGCINNSELIFNSMSIKNIVTWNTVFFGYVNIGLFSLAITLFCKMQLDYRYHPDTVSMIPIIRAASGVMASRGVEIVHGLISQLGFHSSTQVLNSLIDSYAKNGDIAKAKSLFTEMGYLRDRCSWNVMLSGYGMNGKGKEACTLFSCMEKDGYKPDLITFTSLLSSCGHSGLIEEGCMYFDMMVTKYKISPNFDHLTCIVDMLSRAGRLEDACKLIRYCQTSDNVALSDCNAAWGALLSASRLNLDVGVGEFASKKLSELAPENCGFHTLMSNLYASSERWDEAVNVRRVFENGQLMKKTGLSFVEM